ncbi:MAG: ribokinase [Candidatus Marinimicrobia bacterium]|nr:ribokinase [Candidatus Neomarinimicrobiota bacterium]
MRNNKVIVVGSYNVDMTITTDVFPQAGETVIGNGLTYGHGGKGANQAVSAARSGAQATLFAKVGLDPYGEQAVTAMALEGINTKHIQRSSGIPTGMASITVNGQGENSIVVVSGANWELSPGEVEHELGLLTDADILLTQLETPLDSVATAIKVAQQKDITVILNPAPAQKLPSDLLRDVDIITPNRIEAEMLTGIPISDEDSLLKAAQVLHTYGINIVIITLGTQGVFLSLSGESKLIPAINVEAVDTVGAGDVFNGVLAAHYSDIESIEAVISLAIIAAGLSVTRTGAQTAIPDLETIEAYQQQHSASVPGNLMCQTLLL